MVLGSPAGGVVGVICLVYVQREYPEAFWWHELIIWDGSVDKVSWEDQIYSLFIIKTLFKWELLLWECYRVWTLIKKLRFLILEVLLSIRPVWVGVCDGNSLYVSDNTITAYKANTKVKILLSRGHELCQGNKASQGQNTWEKVARGLITWVRIPMGKKFYYPSVFPHP